MVETYSNLTVNNLAEISFIAGNYYELLFDIYSGTGSPIDVSSASCIWTLAPFGQPDTATLTVTGSQLVAGSSVNRFRVKVWPDDTKTLSGKYIQQPVFISVPGAEYRPCQGVIYIKPQIPSS